jgi:class 3 adenylate cyclase
VRRFAAVLFTDMHGYSRMMARDEAGTIVRLKRHNALTLPIIEKRGGRLIKTIGDALMCEFSDATAAVGAGLEMVAALEEDARGCAADEAVRIRVGIHAGDVVEEGGDLFGETVNIAARLEPLAEPGGLAVSHVVMRAARSQVSCRSLDCGERRLKNIATAVRVFRLTPPSSRAPSPLPRGRARLAGVALAAVAIATLAGFSMRGRAPEGPHRLAVVATREAGAGLDSSTAWAMASRLVEEVDHFREFRPVSPVGVLAVRVESLGTAAALPDEVEAMSIARRVHADTVAALAVAPAGAGELTVAVHVFSVEDPAAGVSVPRERLSAASLDGDGPVRLAATLERALTRQWSLAALTDEGGGSVRSVPFDAYRAYLEASDFCNSGRYELCEQSVQKALARDSQNPLFRSMYGCSLSFRGDDEAATREARKAIALGLGGLSRREKLIIEHDRGYVESEAALKRGDAAAQRKFGLEAEAAARELGEGYHEPLGYVYAAADRQYLLGDIPGARAMYSEARRFNPHGYPAYHEDAKLVLGDGKNAEGRREAARLIWTYLVCNADSPFADLAREDARDWKLERPASLDCARP